MANSPLPARIEIHIHGMDGSTSRYEQTETSHMEKMIDHIDFNRLFSLGPITLETSSGISVFASKQIARIQQ